jgi:hypothetical protein
MPSGRHDRPQRRRPRGASSPIGAARLPPSPSPSWWSTWASPAASRPHVPNGNPYSEANFKTLKVLPLVPRPLRVDPGRPGVLRRLLHVLQPRAPAPGPAPAHAGLGPLRHRHGRLHQAAEVIGEALTAGRPRAHYRLGADAPVIEFLEFVLPDRLKNRLARTALGGPKRPSGG